MTTPNNTDGLRAAIERLDQWTREEAPRSYEPIYRILDPQKFNGPTVSEDVRLILAALDHKPPELPSQEAIAAVMEAHEPAEILHMAATGDDDPRNGGCWRCRCGWETLAYTGYVGSAEGFSENFQGWRAHVAAELFDIEVVCQALDHKPPELPNLFQKGEFHLHSGEVSDWKIDCDALTDADLETIAEQLVKRLPPFGRVSGVPTGGLRLAEVLGHHVTDGAPLLIVDDVLTTGSSMEEHAKECLTALSRLGINPPEPTLGTVIFARGKCPDWITPLFTLNSGMPLDDGTFERSPEPGRLQHKADLCPDESFMAEQGVGSE